MPINGSGDQFIRVQGVQSYTFCDADGGAAGAESEDKDRDLAEQLEGAADAQLDSSGDEAGGQADIDSSDEEAATRGATADGGAMADGGESEFEGGEIDYSEKSDNFD